MKKGQLILLSICAMSLCVVFGIFLGRNIPGKDTRITQSTVYAEATPAQTQESGEEPLQNTKGALDLNTATQSQLMELPGIGEVLAQKILDYRQAEGPFTAVEDLLNVNGIGEKKLEQLVPFVGIGG